MILILVEQQKERKRELAKRLADMNARKREERLAEDEEKFGNLLELQEMVELEDDIEEVERTLAEYQVKSIDDLNKMISTLHSRIVRTKEKIAMQMSEEIIVDDPPPAKQPKLNNMVFENEKAMHTFLQNVRKMVSTILIVIACVLSIRPLWG